MVAGDTAGAAKLVAEEKDRTMAALAPRLAAELYGLDILEENVEDFDSNVTRFVVLTKSRQWAERPSAEARMMTTFIFRVRNVPAALYKAHGRLRHQRRQHDQAGKLPERRDFTATTCSSPISKATPTTSTSSWRSTNCASSRARWRILGVYPAS